MYEEQCGEYAYWWQGVKGQYCNATCYYLGFLMGHLITKTLKDFGCLVALRDPKPSKESLDTHVYIGVTSYFQTR